MIAAVYARKSTDQNLPDAEKSVTRQVEHATAYAARKGWTVDPAHVYQDDGISGAEFVNRPGLAALLAALSPRPPFDALILAESSRLGREQIETAYTLKRIADAGMRVFHYLENREATMDTPAAKVLASLAGFASESERAMARARTFDALARKAKAGHVTGGVVYGYRNVRLEHHVERCIEPTEAAVVRSIFG
jgi:DNA invertase Pin-like site-specific DNA recombinase